MILYQGQINHLPSGRGYPNKFGGSRCCRGTFPTISPRPVGADRSSEIQQLQASEGPSDQISAISLDGAFSFSFRAAVPNVFQKRTEISIFSFTGCSDGGGQGPSLPVFANLCSIRPPPPHPPSPRCKKRQNGRRLDGAWSSDRSRMGKERGNAMPDKKTSWTKQGRTGSKETCNDTTIFENK